MRNDYLNVSTSRKSRAVIPDFSGGADYDKDEGSGSFARAKEVTTSIFRAANCGRATV